MSNQARWFYCRTSLAGSCRPRAALALKMLVGVSKPTASAQAGLAGSHGQVYKIPVIVEENHGVQQVFPGGMPYLGSLTQRYACATDWSDVAHPSLPNYLAIFARSAFNDPQDCAPATPLLGATR